MKKLFVVACCVLLAFVLVAPRAGLADTCNPATADCSGTANTNTGTSAGTGSGQVTGQTQAQVAPSGPGGYIPLAPIPGLTSAQGNVLGNTTAQFLNNLYKFLIGIAAALAVIQIIRGGLNIATQDKAESHGRGREQITMALLGLVLVLSPVLVFSLINPGILNLEINLPPLKLSQYKGLNTGTGGGTASSTPGAQSQTVGSVTINGNDYYKTYTTTNEGDLQQYETACTTRQASCPQEAVKAWPLSSPAAAVSGESACSYKWAEQTTSCTTGGSCNTPGFVGICAKHDHLLYILYDVAGSVGLFPYVEEPPGEISDYGGIIQTCKQNGLTLHPSFDITDYQLGSQSLCAGINVNATNAAQHFGVQPNRINYECTVSETYCSD